MTAYLNQMGLVCSLGASHETVLKALLAGDASAMRATEAFSPGRAMVCGVVGSELPWPKHGEPRFAGRNNRLLSEALRQIRPAVDAAIARYGKGRIAVVLGTSTSSIGDAEEPYFEYAKSGAFPPSFHYGQMNIGTPSEFLAAELGLENIALTISTACSSSAKALASARRYLDLGLCDAVIAGGSDMLCRFTVAGFSALGAISEARSLPMSANRKGINIGEAAALFLVSREQGPVALLGAGETSDAHNISAPEPAGRGAAEAMQLALEDAGLKASEIDYLNLHGTGTEHNDSMESKAVAQVLGLSVPSSSSKALTGHSLGAAGALEAAFCWLLLSAANPQGALIPHVYDGHPDPALPPILLTAAGQALGRPLRRVMSNSFGFGGSNASLILGAA